MPTDAQLDKGAKILKSRKMSGLYLRLELIHTKPALIIAADPEQLKRVINNIISNSVKYMGHDKGIIDIRILDEGESVRIEIEDNGKGIADCAKEKIFDMFYTADSKVADSRRGLGLGLFLCKSIIQAHGGTIQVADNVPHGTIFTFTLQAEEVTLNE